MDAPVAPLHDDALNAKSLNRRDLVSLRRPGSDRECRGYDSCAELLMTMRWAVVAVLLAVAVARPRTAAIAQAIPAPGTQPVFSANSELVVLHVSVEDSKRRHVPGLGKDAFTVFENGEAQQVAMFSGEDVPATVGVLIDNSASMGPSRERVIAAALAFTETSHPEDEIFVLTFNEHVRPAWGPAVVSTTTPAIFKAAVGRAITAVGMTAVYDAIDEGLRRVRRGIHTRQVLVVISDGSDNASRAKERDVIKQVHDSDATVYAVGLIDPVTRAGDPGAAAAADEGDRRRAVPAEAGRRDSRGPRKNRARHSQRLHAGLRAVARHRRRRAPDDSRAGPIAAGPAAVGAIA